MKDPRAEGKSYGLYLILMPVETKISVKVRDDLSELLNKTFSLVDNSRILSNEWFECLKKEILTKVFKKS